MPIFEYKCSQCDRISEFLERNSQDNRHGCQDCGSTELQKQLSTFAAVVKEPEAMSKCQGCPSGQTCPNAKM